MTQPLQPPPTLDCPCSFCGRTPFDFENPRFIQKNDAWICESCVMACYELLQTDEQNTQGLQLERQPDRYTSGAFDHIELYVLRLMAPSLKKQFLGIFTPTGDRGFGLYCCDGRVEAQLSIDWRREPQREATIRAFFGALGIQPTTDYLASGVVPDATRMLAFPLTGSASEVAALSKRILQELCCVSSAEPLDIHSVEK